MKNKIKSFFVCILLFLSIAITSAVNTSMSSIKENQRSIQNIKNNFPTENSLIDGKKVVKVWLKFFVHDEFKKNLAAMVNRVNEIFLDKNSEKNIVFGYNGSSITLADGDFANVGTFDGRSTLFKKLKDDYDNCSNGINVVIGPKNCITALAHTTFDIGKGTAGRPDGGIILEDTCNQDEMNTTLAHELTHALGLSHQQVKWLNKTSGKIESKPLETTLKDYYGPGIDAILTADRLGFSVPPHGYGFYDKDGDCDCENNADEQPSDAGGSLWDINGNCIFGDAEDKDNVLWGRNDQTGFNLTQEQRNATFDTANNTPGYKLTTIGQTVQIPQFSDTDSDASQDAAYDIDIGFLDIIGSLGILYWEHDYLLFTLQLLDEIPDDQMLYYRFFIDIDDNVNTGNSGGYEYLIELAVSPGYNVAALYEWNEDYEHWMFVEYLKWDLASGVEEYFEDYDGGEEAISGTTLKFYVPLDSLNIIYEGGMRVTAVASNEMSKTLDQCPDLYLSKEQEIVPVLNLNPFEGNPEDIIIANGYDFTPNTNAIIEFDGVEVATTLTNDNGDFTINFILPKVCGGYHTVNAFDTQGKFDIRIFIVENQPPNKPTINGPSGGKPGTSYDLIFNAVDPDGDNVKYIIEWGDGNSETTILSPSGTDVPVSHTWSAKGTYTIKVKAQDSNGLIGPEATKTFTCPKSKEINLLLFKLLQNQPNLFPILQKILIRLGLQ